MDTRQKSRISGNHCFRDEDLLIISLPRRTTASLSRSVGTIINTGSIVALWEKGPQTLHLFVRQPKQVAHLQSLH
ncbi:hypothetical protein APA386B_1P28 (plasmid) [Acetobacter pasteurianus 386B]|nr:hypothetical protein APA386B_1P28 [Acetobacter pasteurianus 386B]